MSHEKFLNMIRMQAATVMSGLSMTDIGIVTGYDSTNYLVTVELYPSDSTSGAPALQTGWIPLFTPWVGNGWGLFAPPNIGDIIEVHYQAGSLQNGYAGLRSFNFGATPQNSVPSGEFWLVHSTGSTIRLTNDGKINITANVELDITAPIVNVSSPVVNLGNGAVQALLNAAAATVYNTHTHNVSGGGITLVPNQTMGSSDETTNVFGS